MLTDHGGPVQSVAFAPDGKSFVSLGADGKVVRWDAATLEATPLPGGGRDRSLGSVAVSPDGQQLAVVTAVGLARAGYPSGKPADVVWRVNTEYPGRLVAYSPDGKRLAVNDGRRTRVLNAADGRELEDFAPAADHPGYAAGLAWSPDSKWLAAILPDPAAGTWPLYLWETGGLVRRSARADKDPIQCVAWSPDGKMIVTGSAVGMVTLWDAATLKEFRRAEVRGDGWISSIQAVAFAPDSRTVAAALVRNDLERPRTRVAFVDVATGKEAGFVGMPPDPVPMALAYSPDGNTLAVACGDPKPDIGGRGPAGGVVVLDRRPAD